MSASAGRVLIKPRGVYNSGTAYEMLDSVFFNGSSYICLKDSLGHAPTDSEYWQIFAQGAGVISGAFAGACDSLGSAQVKSVIIPPADNFALQKGVIVGVRFTNTNTFEATSENSIALNVNNTGALPIYFGGTATPLGDNVVAFGEAAYTHFYQYDGTNWVFIGRSGVQTAEQTPLETPISVGGVSKANVEETLGALNTKESNEVAAITDFYGSKNIYNLSVIGGASSNGITYTFGDDESLNLQSGTVSGGAINLPGSTSDIDKVNLKTYIKPSKDYIFSIGNTVPGIELEVYVKTTNTSSWTRIALSSAEKVTFTTPSTIYDIWARIVLNNNTVIPSGGLTLYPMISDARIKDETFAPFTMTNKELTPLYDVPFDLDNSNDTLANTESFFTLSSGTIYTNVLSFTATKEMFGTLILTLNFIDNVNAGSRAIKIRVYRDANNYSDVYEMQTPPISYTADYQNFRYALPVHFKSGDSVYMQALQNSGSNVRVLGRIQFRGIQI